jgi:hypothetical protein
MNKMTKKDRFKKFVKDNEELITASAMIVTGLGVIAVAIAAANKAEKEASERASNYISAHNAWAETENEWIDEQKADGKDVYYLYDGTYLTMPTDAIREWIQR